MLFIFILIFTLQDLGKTNWITENIYAMLEIWEIETIWFSFKVDFI